MARKSSKTAHVLNLLSGGEEKAEQEMKQEVDEQASPKQEETAKVITENLQNTIKDTIEHTIKDTIQDSLKQKEPLPEINITANQASIQTPNPVTTQLNDPTKDPSPAFASGNNGEDPVAELIKNSLIEEHKAILDHDVLEPVDSTTATDFTDSEASPEEFKQPEPPSEALETSVPEENSINMDTDAIPSDSNRENLNVEETIEGTDDMINPDEQLEQVIGDSPKSEDISKDTGYEEQASEEPIDKAKDADSANEEEDIPYQYVNVMEYVVKDKVLYYMEQFGMCTCNRCIADTTALSLTNLPPKYVVVDKRAVSPLLNFYLNKFVGQATVELTKACIMVKDYPHHDS